MILIFCNGKELTARDAGPVLFRLTADTTPLKPHGFHLMEEPAARRLLRELLNSGLYTGGKVDAA